MKRLKFSISTLALVLFVTLWPNLTLAEIEKAVVKIDGGMQCSL